MRIILLLMAMALAPLVVVSAVWLSKGGYDNDKWTVLFFATWVVSIPMAFCMGAFGPAWFLQ